MALCRRRLLQFWKESLWVALFLFCFIVSVSLLPHSREKKKIDLYVPQTISFVTFGYRNLFSDFLWIRAIQDFDYCESKTIQPDQKNATCKDFGWVYSILNGIFHLEPEFKMAQRTGPLVMSVLVEDIAGASRLFWQAYLNFPTDWVLSYRFGYHAYAEMGDSKLAGYMFLQSAKNGGPAWLFELSSSLLKDGGNHFVLDQIVQGMSQGGIDPELMERVRAKLKKSRTH